jgi:UDP-glucose 4-epimerase
MAPASAIYTCVRDLAEVHVMALEHHMELRQQQSFEVFNIGTGQCISVRQMHAAFEQTNQLRVLAQVYPRRPGDIKSMYASTQKAEQILGWSASYVVTSMVFTAWAWQKKL